MERMRFTCSENEGIAALLLRKYVKSYIDHSIAFHLNGWNISIIIMSHTISKYQYNFPLETF